MEIIEGQAVVGAAYGPFDLTYIKIGAYGDAWPDIHLTPEQAVDAHEALRGTLLLPIHWGTSTWRIMRGTNPPNAS
jgi:L-ascorbate metabolism protein UlaG (beta-lactamase superfamily)